MNYYKQAIEILKNTTKEKAIFILYEVAKIKPSVICKASDTATYSKNDSELLSIIKSNRFIEAIKRHRELNGSSLKEAKEHCDKLREGLNNAKM